jgi:hypothetical protein
MNYNKLAVIADIGVLLIVIVMMIGQLFPISILLLTFILSARVLRNTMIDYVKMEREISEES